MANKDSKAGAKAPLKAQKATEVKTIDQLHEELSKLQLEHLESRKSHKQGELVNPHVLTAQRRGIARIHTAITAATTKSLTDSKSDTKEEK
ncbi:MAG: 50S ribosomal protein L29 [Candidatus Microsaccharimonas sossegonensis]|uniref:Large ribosomal subunit protein uL29 n=1 Tax=Candidatus Microsaccharimonas sossegonensis TaxID=2506948 RepID=A0A4Q0AI92_9BACT|nr:MAG: 50S ribosomal protein L29 [Candidatus Microsaccharimonas sossegonensis]